MKKGEEGMGFYWVGLLFWLLVTVSIILFIIGILKRSWINTLLSAVFYLPVGLYLYGAAENWIKAFLLFLLIPVIFTILYFKKNIQK